MKQILTGVAAVALAAATLGAQQTVQINGAGATFPAPIYTKWFSEYNKLHPNIQINYQPVGSGAGIKQLMSHTVFFGASDGPMTQDQLLAAPAVMHFPTVLGAVVPIYNVTGVSQPLTFTGPVLADIFLGKINKWNDPAIEKLNPGVTMPHPTSPSRIGRTAPARVHLVRLPREGIARMEAEGWHRHVGAVADRDCRGKATTASPPSSRRRPARSDTSSWCSRCRTRSATAVSRT